jgi:hypothetical protein
MTRIVFGYGPGSAAHRKGAALRPRNGSRNLQNARDAAINADFIARTGEICMISMTSQIVPSRPMLMLDARVAH